MTFPVALKRAPANPSKIYRLPCQRRWPFLMSPGYIISNIYVCVCVFVRVSVCVAVCVCLCVCRCVWLRAICSLAPYPNWTPAGDAGCEWL